MVVGQPVSTQQISASMTGSVLTASMSEIQDVAAQMLADKKPGTIIVDGSIHLDPGEPTVTPDGVVTYAATATASAYDQELDRAALKEQVRGKTKSVAQGILDQYGTATITLSPDFMPTLPDDPDRMKTDHHAARGQLTCGPSQPSTDAVHAPCGRACRHGLRGSGPYRVSRLLGIDLGTRRIGVALGDLTTGHARPLVTLSRRDVASDAASIGRLAREHDVASWSSACPCRSTDTEGPQAASTRSWVDAVAPLTGLRVTWQDERHTSEDAEQRLGGPGRGRAGGPPSAAVLRGIRACRPGGCGGHRPGGPGQPTDHPIGRPWGAAMTLSGRGEPSLTDAVTGTHPQRQGSISGGELLGLKRARPRGPWRGLVFLVVVMLVIVVGGGVFVGPRLREAAYDLARSNPQIMRLPMVPEIVRERLGDKLTTPAGTRATPVKFTVEGDQSVAQIGRALASQGLVTDALAFSYLAVTQGVDDSVHAGKLNLDPTMTPQQVPASPASSRHPTRSRRACS